MKLNNIIKEEIIKHLTEAFKFDYNNLSVVDLALIAAELGGYDSPEMINVFKEVYLKKFQEKGDQGVVDLFKDSTHTTVHQKRKGRYSFTPQVTPHDYEKKLEEDLL